MRKRSAPHMAVTPADVEAYLRSEDIDTLWVIDEILLDPRARGFKLRKSDVERALRRVMREDQQRRRNLIVGPLLAAITPSERARADAEWLRLASSVFTTDAALRTEGDRGRLRPAGGERSFDPETIRRPQSPQSSPPAYLGLVVSKSLL